MEEKLGKRAAATRREAKEKVEWKGDACREKIEKTNFLSRMQANSISGQRQTQSGEWEYAVSQSPLPLAESHTFRV